MRNGPRKDTAASLIYPRPRSLGHGAIAKGKAAPVTGYGRCALTSSAMASVGQTKDRSMIP
jgi:hypothetical protein